jgi:hypothetical protein
MTLTIAGSPSVAAFAFGGGHGSGYRMHAGVVFGRSSWHSGHARGYGREWRRFGWRCGPYGDNEDGWDIAWGAVCYYPYYGYNAFGFR